jgi:hypothetical protein
MIMKYKNYMLPVLVSLAEEGDKRHRNGFREQNA